MDVVGCKTRFTERRGIMFLGGFRHQPNLDAVLYFSQEVWPLIHARNPDIVFNVIGADAPPEILALHDVNNINVIGFVEELAPWFEAVRLSIAPLRYGAGIKGKVGQSLSHGVPCIATSIAVEGMGLAIGTEVLVADDPVNMAETILATYRNEALWQRLSLAGMGFVEREYSSSVTERRMREVIDLATCIR